MANPYREGVQAMAAGRYREAVAALQTALADAPHDPQVKLWLVMAYEADRQGQAARDLCRELTTHPDPHIRQQSQRVLYILEAPQLQRKPEWLNEIPLLTEESSPPLPWGKPRRSPAPEPREIVGVAPVGSNDFVPVMLAALSVGLLLWAGWG
ncbi:MAG: tetratricopeptide repeat protein [Gloeomargarita sp. DG02_4_bins_56]